MRLPIAAQAFVFDRGNEQTAKVNPYQACNTTQNNLSAVLATPRLAENGSMAWFIPLGVNHKNVAKNKILADSALVLRQAVAACFARASRQDQAAQAANPPPLVEFRRQMLYHSRRVYRWQDSPAAIRTDSNIQTRAQAASSNPYAANGSRWDAHSLATTPGALPPPCAACGAEQAVYVGAVTDDAFPADSAMIGLVVHSRSDTAFEGAVLVSTPPDGREVAAGRFPKDSLTFVSVSEQGDTTLWRTARVGVQMSGRYNIVSGRLAGQHGSWSLGLEQGNGLATPWPAPPPKGMHHH